MGKGGMWTGAAALAFVIGWVIYNTAVYDFQTWGLTDPELIGQRMDHQHSRISWAWWVLFGVPVVTGAAVGARYGMDRFNNWRQRRNHDDKPEGLG